MARIDKVSTALGKKHCGASFYTYGKESSTAVRIPGFDEILFIIMPMRHEACGGDPVEGWLKAYVENGKED